MKNLVLAKLQALSLNGSLPHAWLFVSTDLAHNLQVAKQFSQWLLCTNKQATLACGSCKQCYLFAADSHPDFCIITPAEKHSAILIDEIRTLNEFIPSKPQLADRKIVLLYPAEKMNKQAANALLKNLEEPVTNVLFILLTTHSRLLLKTIVSRCQILPVTNDKCVVGQDIAPLKKILSDLHTLWLTSSVTPVELVEQWVKQWPNEVLYWFELVLTDMILYQYTRNLQLLRSISEQDQALLLNSQVPIQRLWSMLDQTRQVQFWLGNGHKPNMQLALENIILH